MAISTDKLKNSKVLILLGKSRKLNDVLEPVSKYFKNTHLASCLTEVSLREYDLIIVDYTVTDMTGILLYKQLNQLSDYALTPSVFVADTKSYDHRLNAFEIGASDFIHRPFENDDLLRKSILHIQNRRRIFEDQSIQIGNLNLSPVTEKVLIAGKPVSLTQLEFKILHFLLSAPRQVIARSEIYEHVWGPDRSSSGRLDTQLYNLKKKLTNFNGKIKSVNKVGMRVLMAESTFSQEQKKLDQQSLHLVPRP